MNYTKLIAIDPGISGGIVIYSIPQKSIHCGDMPILSTVKKTKSRSTGKISKKSKNETDVGSIAKILSEQTEGHKSLIMVEKVMMRPQDTDHPGKVFRIQKMMANYEALMTVIRLSEVDFVEVVPRAWQKPLNLSKDKSSNKEFAKRNYPMLKITNKTADAVCILHFCRLKLKTDPKWITDRLKTKNEELL